MDHSATTPVDSLVVDAMLPYFNDMFGNSSSLHSFGMEAAEALTRAREQVAEAIGASPEEIIFTSGGTESDNLAIRGVILTTQAIPERNTSSHRSSSTLQFSIPVLTLRNLVMMSRISRWMQMGSSTFRN